MRVLSLSVVGAALSFTLFGNASPPVKVRLRSSWPAPNVLLEILETAALEQEATFFPILDLLTAPETFTKSLASLSNAKVYKIAIDTLLKHGYLSEPGALNTFELSLALHTASPKVEAYYEYYDDHGLAETPLSDGEKAERCTGSWVDWYGQRVCSVEVLKQLVDASGETSTLNNFKPLSFDHVYPPSSSSLDPPARAAILYGDIASPNFRPLHDYLYTLATGAPAQIQYVFRHVPPADAKADAGPNYLSGYGVMMDLKKMDYLALDDRQTGRGAGDSDSSKDTKVEEVEQAYSVLDILGEADADVDLLTALTDEETASISMQAAQLIMQSPEPLKALTDLSQNFPKYATSLARRVTVEEELKAELQANWFKLQDGFSAVWLNGMVLQNSDVSVFGLLRLLRKEREIIGHLRALGLSAPQAIEFLTHDVLINSQAGNPVTEGFFDASDRKEGGDTIVWWNDIEKDSRYNRWSASLKGMLQPVWPGQLPTVKRNLFNTIMVLDLSERTSLAWIAGPISNIIQRGYPWRFGVVPIVETEEAARAARLFLYMVDTFGRAKTMNFIKTLAQSQTYGTVVDFDVARQEYNALIAAVKSGDEEEKAYLSFDHVLSGEGEEQEAFNAKLDKARAYAKRLGTTVKSSPQGHAFINGKYTPVTDEFLTALQTETAQQTQYLQELIFSDKITDDEDVSVYFYDLPTTASRRNKYIYPTGQTGSLKVGNIPDALSETGLVLSASDFVYPKENRLPPVTIWVVADFDTAAGASLLKESLLALGDLSNHRVGFVHNPSTLSTPSPDSLSYKLSRLQAAKVLNSTSASNILAVLDESYLHAAGDGQQVVLSDDVSEVIAVLSQTEDGVMEPGFTAFRNAGRLFARALSVPAGESWLLVNGRLVGPVAEGDFTSEDFEMLAEYELAKRVGPVVAAYTNVTAMSSPEVGEVFSNNIALLSAVVLSVQVPDPSQEGLFNVPQRPRNRRYLLMDGAKSSFSFGDNSTASYQIAFILDPVSDLASRWSPLISWLASLDSVYIQVFLNPPASSSELPLKQFYRFSLPHRLSFDKNGAEVVPTVEFRNLPPDPIYTLGMDVPQAWLVRPHVSHHDLDNIHLASFTGLDKIEGVEAIFNLDYIVVEGHARDSVTGQPPRGLQLQLSNSNSTPVDDTQVVANLGYIQFKTKPGVFQLEIREGYGREVYDIESVGNEGWNSPPVTSAGTEITVTSLEGITLYPRFKKKPGMEKADVLKEPVKDKGVVDSVVSGITSIFKGKKDLEPIKQDQAEINIFTVASGLLYERFVGIMILSVLRNTKSTVKFWFIENFLSPSFLEFIPHLAKAYNFQYELVTYKWPSWLRTQKEKQRVIWGYKILFLDVLFPMDLKKVIFVDADQIVRADLKELVDLDLHGAPYGYTPMGDDNKEMEGFRFWKTGYWRDFLKGKPYHISALYVIDLVRFRQLAAGDRLRGSYQALSQDPNSLANLDQDLPNNLQFDVPIFSLPEDWLWCETWCSKERLHRAKTIDLCQNPMTKEPKLSRARQIPEWEEYDQEIANFAKKLADEGLIRSAAYAAGVDDLANVGKKATAKTSTKVGEASEIVTGSELHSGKSEEPASAESSSREGSASARGNEKEQETVVPRDEL